jgi:heat shock protein HslJ
MHLKRPYTLGGGRPALGKALVAATLATLLAACGSPLQGAPMSQPSSPSSPPPPSLHTAPSLAQTLRAYDWDLVSAHDARGQAALGWLPAGQRPLRLHFEDQQLSVQNLCNAMSAGYSLSGPSLQVGPPMSTKRACAERDLMALEQRVATLLPQARRLELRDGTATGAAQLAVWFADGSRWELAGSPTPATRYGSAGERQFLEVAPERVACNHPLMPQAQCLRVRDVRYADNGVRQGVGEWRIFQGEIEGYRHEPGLRNVLRVQRYSLARNGQLPADAPSHVYVLDLVVETERVR